MFSTDPLVNKLFKEEVLLLHIQEDNRFFKVRKSYSHFLRSKLACLHDVIPLVYNIFRFVYGKVINSGKQDNKKIAMNQLHKEIQIFIKFNDHCKSLQVQE
jgi:hypothetical protein